MAGKRLGPSHDLEVKWASWQAKAADPRLAVGTHTPAQLHFMPLATPWPLAPSSFNFPGIGKAPIFEVGGLESSTEQTREEVVLQFELGASGAERVKLSFYSRALLIQGQQVAEGLLLPHARHARVAGRPRQQGALIYAYARRQVHHVHGHTRAHTHTHT